ncbi:MAG: CaiB/BaiF CoA transferase family protein, partial [Dehalococcoidia bacterium]
LVTNLMVGPLAEFGADEVSTRAINPRLVYARAAGFGEAGPWANDPCQDTVGMAYGGLLFTCSNDGETPYYPPGAMSDVLSGTMMAFGILAALRERDRTGEGQYVSTSQVQTLMWMQSLNVAAVSNLGKPFEVSDRLRAPSPIFNTYRCGDGKWIALGMAIPTMWGPMCEAIGRPELADDPRFADARSRMKNAEECVRILDAHYLTGTSGQWLDALRARGLWVGPINRVEDLITDEQVRANGYIREIEGGGTASRMPFTLRGHEPGRAAAPAHGADSDAVLGEVGFDAEAVAELRAAGVVW